MEALPPPNIDISDVELARAQCREHFRRIGTRSTPPRTDVTVQDLVVPSLIDEHAIPVRVYRPNETSGRGLLYMHGGSFVLGDLELEDENCYMWARDAGCVVVAVDYRLAPEHPFPVPLEDCHSALRWLADRADELAIDRRRIGVGGCSAGGALAAGLAHIVRDWHGPDIALQMLLYPALDASLTSASIAAAPADHRSGLACMWDHYLAGLSHDVSPYASPASSDDLRGLPAAYIVVAEMDPLRDEAITYAQRLLDAGVSVELRVWPSVPHAFELFVPDAAIARQSVREQANTITRLLG